MFASVSVLAVSILAEADTVAPVSGTVHTADGRPAPQVLVIVRDSVRGVSDLAVTDGAGKFRLPRPDDGVITIVATTADGGRGDRLRLESAAAGSALDLVLGPAATPLRRPSSAAWLALLPDSEERRRMILDCTGCHQFDETRTRKDGAPRSVSQWAADVQRMLGYAGPKSSFPVISNLAEGPVAEWLVESLAARSAARGAGGVEFATDATVTEYDFPVPSDLPHDLTIERSGDVVVTGMLSHAMYRLDPELATFERIPIPVPQANPRAVELDDEGNWWVLLGGPAKVGRYDVGSAEWRFFDIGMYPHSIAVAGDGAVWFDGHFTRDPERIGRIDPASGAVQIFDLPAHRSLRSVAGGPIPYEQRIGPDGRVWLSELQGNRIIAFDPRTRRSATYSLPTPWSGPRRFDIDASGILWIPAYGANALVRLDRETGQFTEMSIPIPGATPYIARVDPSSGSIWVGTSAADAVLRYDPAAGTFAIYPLASQGALVRHMAIDTTRGDVWLTYGASPGRIPARVARIRRVVAP